MGLTEWQQAIEARLAVIEEAPRMAGVAAAAQDEVDLLTTARRTNKRLLGHYHHSYVYLGPIPSSLPVWPVEPEEPSE